jgi:hypothetical protein
MVSTVIYIKFFSWDGIQVLFSEYIYGRIGPRFRAYAARRGAGPNEALSGQFEYAILGRAPGIFHHKE